MSGTTGPLFPANVLANYLNDITNQVTTSADNISNPSPNHVQILYFETLMQFGFSTVLLTNVPPGLRDLPASEFVLIKGSLPVVKILVAGRLFFSTIPDCDFKFGLGDLLDPKPLRTRKFLSILVNFWLLCNNQYASVSEIQNEVIKKSHHRKELEAQITEHNRMILDNRQSKVQRELEAKKLEADYNDLSNELQRKCAHSEELKILVDQEKALIKELEQEAGSLRKDLEGLITIEKRLRFLIHSDEAKKTLQEDLIRADNEFTAHIQQQEAYHQRLAIAEQKESEVISFLDSHQSLSELISRVRNLTDEIKSKEKAVEPVRPSLLSKDEKLAEIGKLLSNLKIELPSVKTKWSKRRLCMEAELQDYKEKLSKIQQDMTEEDIITADLESNISKIKAAVTEHEIEFKRSLELSDEKCASILSSLEAFEKTIGEEIQEILSDSRELEKYNLQ